MCKESVEFEHNCLKAAEPFCAQQHVMSAVMSYTVVTKS
jgi:hypothetical protein